jgi:hypothetical protein
VKLGDFIGGLTTLRPYYKDGDGYHLGAEHDVFYAYATDRPLSPNDVQRMRDLGWFQSEVDDDDDGNHGQYDPEGTWSAFV